MKKVLFITIALAIVAGGLFFSMVRNAEIRISEAEVQAKAQEKFPQWKGKAVALPIPPKPKFPRLPIGPKLELPDLPKHGLMLTFLEAPKIDLVKGAVRFNVDVKIRFTGHNLFGLDQKLSLPVESKFQPMSKALRQELSQIEFSSGATIRKSGKDTWMVQDQLSEYFITSEQGHIEVFRTTEDGQTKPSIRTTAKAEVTGELKFVDAEKTIFLQNLQVQELKIGKLPDSGFVPIHFIKQILRERVTTMLQEDKIPVCDLKETAEEKQPKLVQFLGKLLLNNVQVEEDAIILKLKW